MRSPVRWLLLLAFVVLNGFIVYWVWQNLSPPDQQPEDSEQQLAKPEPPSTQTKAEQQRAGAELTGRTDKMAYDLIAKWKRDPVINLESDELPSAVESLPEAGCIGLPDGAIAMESAALSTSVKRDLDTAVTGLLQAYREGTSDALIKYMRGRGKVVGQDQGNRIERILASQGVKELEKLTDEDVYRTMWTTFKPNAHWSGLVADSSCRQFWDGKNVLFNRVGNFNQNLVTGQPLGQMEQADYLVNLLRGVQSSGHNFVSTTGSLEDAHKSDAKVLLCDVQLVMELDESFSHAKVPYLIRFWFNEALQKWQPVDMLAFTPSPKAAGYR